MAFLGVFTWSTPVLAQDAGEAVVVAGEGSTRRLAGGGSATEFSVRLPVGASCPGDSANDGYRVQSFMVPTTVTPPAIQFDGLGPAPNAYGDWETFRQPLYDTATKPFVSALTAVAVAPGRPGAIVNIPPLSFAVYGPGELPPGRYHLGIACTLANRPVTYWDTEVVVAGASDDKPAGITWKLANAAGATTSSNGLPGPAPAFAAAVAVAVGASVYVRRRLRPRSLSEATEDR